MAMFSNKIMVFFPMLIVSVLIVHGHGQVDSAFDSISVLYEWKKYEVPASNI